jgi:hypothetical protein
MTKDFMNVGKAYHESNANLISIPPHCYLMRQFRTPPSTPISPVGWKIYAPKKKREGEPPEYSNIVACLFLKIFSRSKAKMGVRELAQKPLVT